MESAGYINKVAQDNMKLLRMQVKNYIVINSIANYYINPNSKLDSDEDAGCIKEVARSTKLNVTALKCIRNWYK